MNTITHEKLEQMVTMESAALRALCATFMAPVSCVNTFIKCVYLVYGFSKLFPRLDEIERGCETCENSCDFPIQNELRAMRDELVSVIKRDETTNILPFFFKRYAAKAIDRLDDKLENYALASDPEIKDLVNALSGKLNSHARS